MKKLEDIPYFALDNGYIRLNNVLVIVYMAYKLKLEVLWERFLNYIVLKYFFKRIFEQSPDHCNYELFVFITRAVGNLDLKESGQHLSKITLSFLNMETLKKQNSRNKIASTRNNCHLKSSTKNWIRKKKKLLISQGLYQKR